MIGDEEYNRRFKYWQVQLDLAFKYLMLFQRKRCLGIWTVDDEKEEVSAVNRLKELTNVNPADFYSSGNMV